MAIKTFFPTTNPALSLNFAQTKRLDPRISFSRASTGTYVGSDGLIKTAPNGVPRFNHDPETGESLGLLVEESRTNVVQHSEDFSAAYWLKSATGTGTAPTVIPNAAIAPNGTITAAQISFNRSTTTNSDISYVQSGNLAPTAIPYSGGLWVKAATAGDVGKRIQFRHVSGGAPLAHTLTLDWQKVSTTETGVIGTRRLEFGLITSAISDTSVSIYAWGAQVEAGSFPTSYIPTGASTATRAADVASITNSSIYTPDSFTIINKPYGTAAGASSLSLIGPTIERTTVYNEEISQTRINGAAEVVDNFWRWRILGSSFALPSFITDGQVTVDWGDGTVETLTTSEHTFTNGGGYHDVGFRLDSGTYFRPNINNNATHKTKVVATGPAPAGMKLNAMVAFFGCSGLKAVDATIDATGGTNFNSAWYNCTSLTSFPLIDTSSGTNFSQTWRGCSSLTSFPLIDTSSGTNFSQAWDNCSSLTSFPLINTSSGTSFLGSWLGCTSLTSFPLIDTSSGTNFQSAWNSCTSLTSFPLIDTSAGTNFIAAWQNCTSLTSFPLINTSAGTSFNGAWLGCNSLTSFPLIDTSAGTNFDGAWQGCSSLTSFPLINTAAGTIFRKAWIACTSLTTFPANFFDSWTGTPANNCFVQAWDNCPSLTATSVENILNSIDTSGQSAPASGVDITIDYDAGSGTPSVATAVTNLKGRGWTITLNGVAQ